ncbi:SIMPL domain-containing protein [Erythrobacter sp. SCSIO 43205]|uniref:SIMPL domain-containing protein n=1 Tax=Erythrobacter sp. SCSIO 43205 TaxID=2779361 RepID=UPI001CA7C341|nr:SIMPL domain-containing protein [Erythrobacter sp. SCSIO 43205]UAB76810.1 SIMPL domain-containing protein [Erythrobacter sp. SCSIO 43205]
MIRYALALGLVSGAAAMVAAPANAQEIEIETHGPVIELSVSESVTAEPDLVTIGAGVTSQAATAVEAMRINARQMQSVINEIKALGVQDKDIQTTGINLNAQYDYDRTNQRQVFRGYQVSNRVSVKLRDVEGTGAALDALVAAGATDLSGPTFSIENDEDAKATARERAIERAQARAEAYAKLFGFDGVKVMAVSESLRGSSPAPQMVMRSAVLEADAAAPVQPGQVSTGVNLSIKYEMVNDGE